MDLDRNLRRTETWTHDEQPLDMWQKQYDYRTSVKAYQIAEPMLTAGIVNLTLDERLACGRDDRPSRRSAIVLGFALNEYVSRSEELMEIRAPIGWLFDSDCKVYTQASEVCPLPALRPSRSRAEGSSSRPVQLSLQNNTPELLVQDWPAAATVLSCRGDGHLAPGP